MAAQFLAITALASLVASAAFVGLALALRRRRYSAELRRAGQAFALWWAIFGFEALTDAARTALAMGESPNVDAYVWLARAKIVAAGFGIWALGRYVIFLRSGRSWFAWPLSLFAATHAAFFLWGLQAGLPARIAVDAWAPRLVLTGPGTGAPPGLAPLTLVFFFLPPIALAVAYLFLARRLETRTQRVRVVTIAASILVFQVVGTIQFNPNAPADSPLFALLPILSAAVGLLVWGTYKPPRWVTRKYGITALAAGPAGAS